MSKRKTLRALIEAPEILAMPGVFDGFSARLTEASGFAAGFVSGAGVSEASLGWADVGILGFDENLRAARALAGACNVPLIADADTGYGNAVNVHFTVRGFENAGLAGVMIEDQVWPKRCGHMKGKEVIPADEGAAKIRAAAEARLDPDLIIMSRTDALATHGLDEVVRRLNMYAEAGADLLFADAVLTVEHISTIVRSVPKPLCVNMGFGIRKRSTTPLLSARELEGLGVAVVIYPRLLTAASVQGMKNAIAALKEQLQAGTVTDRPDLLVSFEELNELVGIKELERLEQHSLTSGQLRQKYEGAASRAAE
ncbi:MAG TPA: isocitrate lyase/PEP mutase family protein [Acetobacteraceae bacterium]|nr:isocitrate lyase/PEP mutase family protein [Acetobacteraceae bacterium]